MIGGTQKHLTQFEDVISEEETECVGAVWFALVIGHRKIDGKAIIELRTWKGGMLQDVVQDFFDCRVAKHRFETDFERLKEAKENEKLEHWVEGMRHG